jgi:putative ABC transport system permease protein
MSEAPRAPRPPAWRRYLRFWGPDVDADVDDELRFHLDMRARDFEARGLNPDDARRAATERFGDVTRIEHALRSHDRRRHRTERRREIMQELLADVRYAWRGFRRAPGFTATAVLTLALGIGATTAIFSVVHAVLLRPLPYREADRLVNVWMDNRRMGIRDDLHAWANVADMRRETKTLSGLAIFTGGGANLSGDCRAGECEPERIRLSYSTANLFSVLGVSPVLGRVFSEAEEPAGRDQVVVIGHGLWMRMFGGDSSAIGRTVRLSGTPYQIIGVMPPGFAFPEPQTTAWAPHGNSAEDMQQRQSFGWYAIGRLAPGATLAQARTELSTIATRLERAYPGLRDYNAWVIPLSEQVIGPTMRRGLWVMLAAVAAVLIIACANVANLLLSRAAVREREMGVRIALGAVRGRLVRQLLTESLVLSSLGAAAGLAIAWLGLRALIGLAPADIPRLDEVRLDATVLAVALGLAIVTGLGFGLVPALKSSRRDLSGALREGGRGGTEGRRAHRLRGVLVASQVALVVVLLTTAGLMLRSVAALQRTDTGFRPENLLTMRLALSGERYNSAAKSRAFFDQLFARLNQLPGVEGSAAIRSLFLATIANSTNFSIEGRDRTPDIENTEIPLDPVTPDYFRVAGVRLVRGRTFTAADDSSAPPVAIINENMARKFWPNEDAIGKRFRYGGAQSQAPWMTIVGIVADMRRTGYDAPVRYETFYPYAQRASGGMMLLVRTKGEPLAMAPTVRGVLRDLDPELPVYEVKSGEDHLAGLMATRRFSMTLLAAFAGLALVLGVVGVYGVTAFLVSQRTREVGVRLALGAPQGQVVRMVVAQGMIVAGAGLAVGLVVALSGTRLMGSLLYGVEPRDAITLVGVSVVLLAATFFANWLPARRAADVDPLIALRSE